MSTIKTEIQPGELLADMRKRRPLVQCITNFVAMQTTANVLLAAGASPAMVMAPEEVAEFTRHIGALNINIGTLTTSQVKAMKLAITAVNERGTPWVLDPVGAGATTMRIDTARQLAAMGPAIIRGNASEILALAGQSNSGKGVDATDTVSASQDAAQALARETGAIVCVTGGTDLVVSPDAHLARISNGHEMMPNITALGCALTALLAAFAAGAEDRFATSLAALATYGIAGQFAAEKSSGPGSFAVHFLDALHTIKPEDVNTHARIEP